MTQREHRIRSFALKMLVVAGYVAAPRLRQALRIAARCEKSMIAKAKK